MSINVNDKNLGHATAYAYYKAGGGTMTEAEFTEFMADFGTASQTAVEAAQAALASETAARNASTTATNKATEATTAATTATTKAGEASTSASTATSAKDTAVSASQTATTKATEATTAAATATSAKTDAVAANTAAQSAKTAAQTAQTGAETAAASVSASAEQIATNAEDISQLKSDLIQNNEAIFKKIGETFLDNLDGYKIPVLYLENVPEEILAEDASKSSGTATNVTFNFPAYRLSGKLSSMKIQGSSSTYFPKKNYSLKFDESFEAQPTWGKQTKYVIKSNYNDATQAHNSGCAKLWGKIRASRVVSDDIIVDTVGNTITDENDNTIATEGEAMLAIGMNFGAIDGFPVCVVINGNYWGLYSFNAPKDSWMARMGAGNSQAILSSDYSTTYATLFKGLATFEPDSRDVQDFEIEYKSDNLTEADIKNSINTLITAVMQEHSTDQEYYDDISQYLDIDSAIDYLIFTCAIGNSDGVGKNYLLDTFDGIKWFFVAYDMDMVFGNNSWDGTVYGSPLLGTTFASFSEQSRLMNVIYNHFRSALIARYKALRNGALSEANVHTLFTNYVFSIPRNAFDYESLKWRTTNGTSVLGTNQICEWYRLRIKMLDDEIDALSNS